MNSNNSPRDSSPDDDQHETHRDDAADRPETDATIGWWDEKLVTTFLVVGVLLFVFPEPVTSLFGIALVLFGAIGWLFETLV